MLLETDDQTIEDLRIFARRESAGLYDLYNQTHTRGGELWLKGLFTNPLADKDAINKRSSIIRHFARLNKAFPFDAAALDMAEKYLMDQQGLAEKEVHNGVTSIITLIRQTREFVTDREVGNVDAYADEKESIVLLLSDQAFEPIWKGNVTGKLSYTAVLAFDVLFRSRERDKIEQLLGYIYRLDVYLSVAKLAVQRGWVFPRALDKGQCILQLEGVYHPELKDPVSNSLVMDAGHNVIFLTGANMAGKSTLLRAVSTALYTAHVGFPVAAVSMEFSVMDGIYTTINLPDNLGIGASHFYAEVLRVKKVATALSQGKSLFVLFDELFRGTNVKDAHEATMAVTRAFAGKKDSLFIISSHIVEAADALQQHSNIDFLYLPTRMNGYVPAYTYKLEEGVTNDRHGMIIIKNEGILEILKNRKKIL